MKKSPWRHLKNKWLISLVIIGVIGGATVWARSGSGEPEFESVTVTRSNVIEMVGVTGTISPFDKAGLAFEKSGVVAEIRVRVGDQVKKGQILAKLESAGDAAALAAAEATLADMSRSLTGEELAVQKTLLDNARNDAINASQSGFVKAQSALFNNTDGFFANPQSVNPTVSIRVSSLSSEKAINAERLKITELLDDWSASLTSATPVSATLILSVSRAHLAEIRLFLEHLSVIVSDLSTGNSSLTQTQINTHIATMNTALTAINTAIDGVTAAETALASAKSNYDLKLSGNSSQSIAAQAAKVAQARAVLAQDTLTSPLDGIITKAEPSVGEFVAAGATSFMVQNSDFKIEAYVPEADIAKVTVGDLASSTLDAYGSAVDFPAQVVLIDPAETVLEGVPTYKVTLVFLTPDTRIRSGMTANLDIVTEARYDVLAVPYRSVLDEDGTKSVRVVDSTGQSFSSTPVTVGLKGSSGTIEILSGLTEGDEVVTYVK